MNQPQQRLHQRWRRGRHPERKTGSREWEGLPHTREKTHQRVRRGRSPCMESSSSSSRPGQVRRRFWEQENVTVVSAPEEVPPDAENTEDSWSRAETTERCPEPRTAQRRRRAKRARTSGGGANVAGSGLVRRLLWRTRPKPARARHKAIESWKLDA